ncbi:MFS transporter [Gluconobacter morbifer]|nr:MFS transporter [Gluconobacter morbifer]
MDPRKKPLVGLAGIIGLAMATELNEQVSAQTLRDIMGGLGFSHDAGTWFTSLYGTAEVIGMAFAPWLAVTFSLRRFAFFVVGLALVSSVFIPFTSELSLLYILRMLQGLAGGFAVPLLMTTALRVLAPPIRLYGLAAYASTATFFPYLSGTFAGLWSDLVGWQFVFWQTIPFCTLAGLLVWYGMPVDEPKYERFKIIDWRGMLLIFFGFSALTTMLQQGDRLDWFNSKAICVMALVSAVTLPLFVVNEWSHPLPLFKFQLLKRRNFAYGATTLLTFVVISISSSTIPASFLTTVAGYRPEQAYLVTAEIACMQLVLLPLMAVVLNQEWVDSRVVSLCGLCCILTGCIGDTFVTSVWNRNEFYLWQFFQGLGAAMIVMPLLMMSTNMVTPAEGPFASALVNCPRGVAQTVSVWLIQLVHRYRGSLHSDRLTDLLGRNRFRLYQGNSPALQEPPPFLPNGLPRTPDSVGMLSSQLARQTATLMVSDLFFIILGLVAFLMMLLLTLPVRTYPPRIVLAKK